MGFSSFVPDHVRPPPAVKLPVVCPLPCRIRTVVLTRLGGRMGTTPSEPVTYVSSSYWKCHSFSWICAFPFVEKFWSVSRVLKWLLLTISCNFIVTFWAEDLAASSLHLLEGPAFLFVSFLVMVCLACVFITLYLIYPCIYILNRFLLY